MVIVVVKVEGEHILEVGDEDVLGLHPCRVVANSMVNRWHKLKKISANVRVGLIVGPCQFSAISNGQTDIGVGGSTGKFLPLDATCRTNNDLDDTRSGIIWF